MQGQFPAFLILEMLGRGGMGAVYKAWQLALERYVAIKVLRQSFEADHSEFVELFKREAKTMAKLHHHGIISVMDAGETPNGLLYIVMEYVQGTDVARMVKAQGRLAPEQALAVCTHVCDALHYAHTRGVMHRDIKPANIIINTDGQVKVADFGIGPDRQPQARDNDHGHAGLRGAGGSH